jgi:hypothetical protein
MLAEGSVVYFGIGPEIVGTLNLLSHISNMGNYCDRPKIIFIRIFGILLRMSLECKHFRRTQ